VHYTKYIKMCSFSFTEQQSATKTIKYCSKIKIRLLQANTPTAQRTCW